MKKIIDLNYISNKIYKKDFEVLSTCQNINIRSIQIKRINFNNTLQKDFNYEKIKNDYNQ